MLYGTPAEQPLLQLKSDSVGNTKTKEELHSILIKLFNGYHNFWWKKLYAFKSNIISWLAVSGYWPCCMFKSSMLVMLSVHKTWHILLLTSSERKLALVFFGISHFKSSFEVGAAPDTLLHTCRFQRLWKNLSGNRLVGSLPCKPQGSISA